MSNVVVFVLWIKIVYFSWKYYENQLEEHLSWVGLGNKQFLHMLDFRNNFSFIQILLGKAKMCRIPLTYISHSI